MRVQQNVQPTIVTWQTQVRPFVQSSWNSFLMHSKYKYAQFDNENGAQPLSFLFMLRPQADVSSLTEYDRVQLI